MSGERDSQRGSQGDAVVRLDEVKEYWDSRSPGLRHSKHDVGSAEFLDEIEKVRYGNILNYKYLLDVAEFDLHSGESVLEVGVGLGTDLLQFAKNDSKVSGIDLAPRAVELTRERFRLAGLEADLRQASFTEIPFDAGSFDVVYSFGVLHHSAETQQGIDEIFRVLKPGGRIIVMLYHKGFKYYVRKLFLYGVLKGELLRSSVQEIINRHSEDFGESPLTKVYTRREARRMFERFDDLSLKSYRLDDYLPFRGRHISPSRIFLPAAAYRALENLLGWNLVIKGNKPRS